MGTGVVQTSGSGASRTRRRISWIAAAALAVLVLCLVRVVHAPKPTEASGVVLPRSTLSRNAQEAEIVGLWQARGHIVQTSGFVNDHQGQARMRRWEVARRCAGTTCPLYLTVPTTYGPRSARLVWSNGLWAATLDLSSFCESSTSSRRIPGAVQIRRTLTVTTSGVHAVEQDQAAAAGGCPPAHTLWEWVASRVVTARR